MPLTTFVTLAVLLAAVLMLYSRRVQGSSEYQATVVPLANMMDIGVGSQASASTNAISSRSDVLAAVSVASRVFAIFFAIQCLIAVAVARRRGQWWNVVGLGVVGLAMVGIAVFGLSA